MERYTFDAHLKVELRLARRLLFGRKNGLRFLPVTRA